MPRKYNRMSEDNNKGLNRTIIDRLAINYDVPMERAVCLVGKTEWETWCNVRKYLR